MVGCFDHLYLSRMGSTITKNKKEMNKEKNLIKLLQHKDSAINYDDLILRNDQGLESSGEAGENSGSSE